eukprot:scaffold77322_cov58-Phaeocystis_antarctica.AAC.2
MGLGAGSGVGLRIGCGARQAGGVPRCDAARPTRALVLVVVLVLVLLARARDRVRAGSLLDHRLADARLDAGEVLELLLGEVLVDERPPRLPHLGKHARAQLERNHRVGLTRDVSHLRRQLLDGCLRCRCHQVRQLTEREGDGLRWNVLEPAVVARRLAVARRPFLSRGLREELVNHAVYLPLGRCSAQDRIASALLLTGAHASKWAGVRSGRC